MAGWEAVLVWLRGQAPGVGLPLPCECGGARWEGEPVCPRCVRGPMPSDERLRAMFTAPRSLPTYRPDAGCPAQPREGDRLLVQGHWLTPDGRRR